MRWTNRDWLNGHYELIMLFRDPYAWVEAAQALWSLPCLTGVWTEREFDPEVDPRQDGQNILVACELMERNLLGFADLDGRLFPCGTAVSVTNDWLALFLPLAGLGSVYDLGAFPFADRDRPWISQLDNWLAEIGRKIFHRVPFKIAAVGFEIDVNLVFDISEKIEVSKNRACGLLVPTGDDVQWYPPT